MQNQPEIYGILRHLDISERKTTPDLLSKGDRVLVSIPCPTILDNLIHSCCFTEFVMVQVADDYLGLDVLSSHMDVKTSNFRRVPGLPVYGMAQPSREVRLITCLSLAAPETMHLKFMVIPGSVLCGELSAEQEAGTSTGCPLQSER